MCDIITKRFVKPIQPIKEHQQISNQIPKSLDLPITWLDWAKSGASNHELAKGLEFKFPSYVKHLASHYCSIKISDENLHSVHKINLQAGDSSFFQELYNISSKYMSPESEHPGFMKKIIKMVLSGFGAMSIKLITDPRFAESHDTFINEIQHNFSVNVTSIKPPAELPEHMIFCIFTNFAIINVNDLILVILDDQIIISNLKWDYVVIAHGKSIIYGNQTFSGIITEIECSPNKYTTQSFMTSTTISSQNLLEYDTPNKTLDRLYAYDNKFTRNKFIIKTKIDEKNQTMVEITKKRNLTTYESFDYEKQIFKTHSVCDDVSLLINSVPGIITCMNPSKSSSGLRHRGTYTKISTGSGTADDISLKLDGTEVYKKSGDQVQLDLLSKKDLDERKDFIITWKVAKAADDSDRIVKLGIPPDANIVLPISHDFWATNMKERASKAITLDIQEANIDHEISVVPKERTVYSYIAGVRTAYTIGQVITPDAFDPDPNNSCSHGIHYHRNRRAVFKLWIEGYEDIQI